MVSIGCYVYFRQSQGYIFPPLIQFYLNDLLIVPITAIATNLLMQWILRIPDFKLQIWQICYIVLFYSILFEGILPTVIKRYTGDWVDVLMYVIGGIITGIVLKVKLFRLQQ
jgi:hypothetical protein